MIIGLVYSRNSWTQAELGRVTLYGLTVYTYRDAVQFFGSSVSIRRWTYVRYCRSDVNKTTLYRYKAITTARPKLRRNIPVVMYRRYQYFFCYWY